MIMSIWEEDILKSRKQNTQKWSGWLTKWQMITAVDLKTWITLFVSAVYLMDALSKILMLSFQVRLLSMYP